MGVIPIPIPLCPVLPPAPPPGASRKSVLSGHRQLRPWRPLLLRSRATTRLQPRSSAQDNGGEEEKVDDKDEGVKETAATVAEIKELMKKREEASQNDFWGGVVAEVREIEWPGFGKVLGTTGIVLAVIAGSSVALLTVNAVLAEISDRVFVGRGLQDFFG